MAEDREKAEKGSETEGGVPGADKPRPPLFSPAGWFIVVAVAVVEAALVFMVGRQFGGPPAAGTGPSAQTVTIGETRELPEVSAQLFSGPGRELSATISFQFILELDPKLKEEPKALADMDALIKNRWVEAEVSGILRELDFDKIEQKTFPEEVADRVKGHLIQKMGAGKITNVKVLSYNRNRESSSPQ